MQDSVDRQPIAASGSLSRSGMPSDRHVFRTIVAASIGPIAELCDDGAEARFWPLDNPADAAKILLTFLDDEEAHSGAAASALARFSRDFDATVIAPRLESFLLGATATELP